MKQKAFTLVELLIVVGIIMTIAVISFGGSYAMKDQVKFRNVANNVSAFLRNARNLSLSGQSYLDVDDFDQDGLDDTDGDQVLPNGYIVNIDAETTPMTIELYADLQVLNETNTLDLSDVLIESLDLPDDITASIMAVDQGGNEVILNPAGNISLIYTTPDGDFGLIDDANTTPNISIQLRLMQENNNEEVVRDNYIYMNSLYGTPEVGDESYI